MAEGEGEEMIAQSFSSGSCPIAQEGPAKVYSRFFSPIPAFSKERNAKIERYEWNQTAFDIEGKVTVIDQMKKWTIDLFPQKNTSDDTLVQFALYTLQETWIISFNIIKNIFTSKWEIVFILLYINSIEFILNILF